MSGSATLITRQLAALAASGVLCTAAFAAQDGADADRTLLSRIRSPYDLLLPHLPQRYFVPVALSGSIADEMRRTLKELDIEEPHYIEVYDRKRQFELLLTNKSYSNETRDLLSGILNPVEMIDAVLASVVRYRDPQRLSALLRETRQRTAVVTPQGRPVYVVELAPAGERFGYSYEDLGAYVQETWLTRLSLRVDSASMLATELSIVKYSRLFKSDDVDKPQAKKTDQRYVFVYDTAGGGALPTLLTLYIDSARTLQLAASYRRVKDFLLFDTRQICSFARDGSQSCLAMKYGDFTFEQVPFNLKQDAQTGVKANKIRQAAVLAQKAKDDLRAGKIEAAVRIMRNLVDNYAGTPQAVEARKLLDGLPGGAN